MTPLRVTLPFGLIAEIVTADDDRAPYVPPPAKPPARAPHHAGCPCAMCYPPPGVVKTEGA